jgi:hypothetical protein
MPQAKPSKESSNPNTATRGNAGGGGNRPPRGQRNNTPEARAQRTRAPKTHPTRNAGSRGPVRKDK